MMLAKVDIFIIITIWYTSLLCAYEMIPILRKNGYYQTEVKSADGNSTVAFQTQTIFEGSIIFKESEFHSFPVNFFKAFPNASIVYMGHCGIMRINPEYFKGGHKMRNFYLESNYIEVLPTETFIEFPDLEVLDLRFNRINEVSDSTFAGLTKLQTLNLAGNRIVNITSEIFAPLKSLKQIHLNHNFITTLPSNLFLKNQKVIQMYFQSNEISFIDTNALNYLDNPEIVQMEHNRMEDINLPSIESFYGDGSRLRRLHIGGKVKLVKVSKNFLEEFIVEKPWNTEHLDLSYNKIKDVTFLNQFHELRTLQLAYNPVNPINFTRNLFRKMTKLRTLDLSGIGIIYLPPEVFTDLTSLRELSMKGNLVSQVFGLFAALLPLRNSYNLRILQLDSVSKQVDNLLQKYLSKSITKTYNVEDIFHIDWIEYVPN